MLLADVFDAEVVDDKGEGDGACDVSEETGSVFVGDVAFIREGKFVVSKYFFGIVPTTYVYTVGYSKKLFSL